ncbi:MAG: hypothetical protein GEU79_11745 [Acidimicrobiia bacterium]|nr:hypothetical protein [Acidimicrobiia bacterium]
MTRSRRINPCILVLALVTLVLAACGEPQPSAEESPTTAPVATTQATDSGGENDVADTTSPVADVNEEDPVLASAMDRSWRVGLSGEGVLHRDGRMTGFQFNKLPVILAIDALNEDGWDVAPIFLNQSEAPVQALVQGSVDVANSSVTPVITGAAAGAPIKSFAKTRNVEYVMLTTIDIETPEDLDGKRIGIHANASTTTLLSKLLLADYPDVEPTYLVIPGSPNRIQAMIAGELDASATQFGDDTTAMEQAPGEFHIIFDFAEEMPQLVDSVLSYNSQEVDEETQHFMELLLAQQVKFNNMIYDDADWALEVSEEMDVIETGGIDRFVSSGIFPTDHGLDAESLDFTIQGLIEAELIEPDNAPSGDELYDGSVWENAQTLLDG